MKEIKTIGVTGATGFIGRHWIRFAGNYETVAFTRSPAKPTPGAVETRAFTSPMDVSNLDAIIHLAGESVFGFWTAKKKEAIRRSRIDGTRALADAIRALPETERPRVLISASAIGFYGPSGDAKLTEACLAGEGFLADVTRSWEQEAFEARELGVRVVALRTGIVLGEGGGALKQMALLFKAGLGGRLGNGRQWMSWIHIDDLIGIILHAIEDSTASGPWNATAPNPVRNSDFTRELARILHRPAMMHAPAFALRLALGEFSGALLESQRVIPEKALAHGYRFVYPDLSSALADLE